MGNQKTIIVKKVKKTVAGGHHGGAWKVAFADFVTAMMAFFLLLWLLSMTSDEKRVRLSTYFKHFSIYTEGGTSFMGKTSEIFSDSGESKQKVFSSKYGDEVSNVMGTNKVLLQVTEDEVKKAIGESLKKDVTEQLGDVEEQVLVELVDGGVSIQMVDMDGSSMFEAGNNRLTPKAREIFRVIGQNINALNNKVSIEGHTDSVPFARSDYSNWELSTERASTARRELEANGLDPERILRVSGLASTAPLIKEDPSDPRNRRITIILKISRDDVRELTGSTGEEQTLTSDKIKALMDKMEAAKGPKTAQPAGNNTGTADKLPADKHWNPVTDGNTHEPVIKNNWNPVLEKGDNRPVPESKWAPGGNGLSQSKWVPDGTGKNGVSQKKKKDHVSNQIPVAENKKAVTSVIKKRAGSKKVIEELSSPIMKKGGWSPVFDN